MVILSLYNIYPFQFSDLFQYLVYKMFLIYVCIEIHVLFHGLALLITIEESGTSCRDFWMNGGLS